MITTIHVSPQWYIVSHFKITQQFSAPDSLWAFYKITEHKITIHSFNKQYIIFIQIASFAVSIIISVILLSQNDH